jgi:hypothetical protein
VQRRRYLSGSARSEPRLLIALLDNHIECKAYDRVVVNDPNEDYQKATKAQEKTADQFAKDQADASKGIEPVNK